MSIEKQNLLTALRYEWIDFFTFFELWRQLDEK